MNGVHQKDPGFTLVELMMVTLLLGVLAAIVVLAIGNSRESATSAICRQDYRAIQLSAEAVFTKMGAYPSAANNNARLVAGNAYGPSGGDNGALLKAYPTSANYALTYAPGGSNGFTITVLNKDGIAVGGGAGSPATPSAADCNSL